MRKNIYRVLVVLTLAVSTLTACDGLGGSNLIAPPDGARQAEINKTNCMLKNPTMYNTVCK